MTFHGAGMHVPAAWPTSHTLCVGRSAVITSPLASTSCPVTDQLSAAAGRTVVTVTCATDPTGFPRSTLETSRLRGEPVLVPNPHGPIAIGYTFVEVPRLNLALTITGPGAAQQAVLTSLSIPARTPPATELASSCSRAVDLSR